MSRFEYREGSSTLLKYATNLQSCLKVNIAKQDESSNDSGSITLSSTDLNVIIKRIEKLERENKYLKDQVKDLNSYADEVDTELQDIHCQVNQIDQNIRRENVTISGLPEHINDIDLEGKVIETLQSIDVNVSSTDIVFMSSSREN